ncbi:hypothetical protein AgCh_010586 [Apium graveolens]
MEIDFTYVDELSDGEDLLARNARIPSTETNSAFLDKRSTNLAIFSILAFRFSEEQTRLFPVDRSGDKDADFIVNVITSIKADKKLAKRGLKGLAQG